MHVVEIQDVLWWMVKYLQNVHCCVMFSWEGNFMITQTSLTLQDPRNGNDSAIILTDYAPPEEGSVIRQPIPLHALAPHVERMHLNENCGFGEEYRVSPYLQLAAISLFRPPESSYLPNQETLDWSQKY